MTAASTLVRLFIAVLFGSTSVIANAAPRISDEVAGHVPRRDIQKLIEAAEQTFHLKVKAVDYAFLDAPPVGDPAAVVRFEDQQTSANVYASPSALYYYLPWFKTEPLDASKRKLTKGRWATTGDLKTTTRFRFELESGTFPIESDNVPYDLGIDLLRAIERDDYEVSLGKYGDFPARITEQSSNTEFRGLKIQHIRRIFRGGIAGARPDLNANVITLDVLQPDRRAAHWVFVKTGARWTLVEAFSYVI